MNIGKNLYRAKNAKESRTGDLCFNTKKAVTPVKPLSTLRKARIWNVNVIHQYGESDPNLNFFSSAFSAVKCFF
jgi:hypothetical protein